jgi:L-ascorbate metabolism protein UlaG (beta-lactamase superfamily)
MSTSDSGLSDEVNTEVNPTMDVPDRGPQAAAIPDRPADGAPTGAWVDYVVALGADRTFVTGDTRHFDGEGYAAEAGLRRSELIELADRLGG